MTHTTPGPWRPTPRWIIDIDGQQLKHARGQHGLTRKELAGIAGVSETTIGRLERQPNACCRSRTLARLAAALGHQPTDLIPPPLA